MTPGELHALDPGRLRELDVRDDLRAGREPFDRIMEAGTTLPPEGVLRLRTLFEPRALYRRLGREGFRHWTEHLGEEDWRIWFWRFQDDRRGDATDAGGRTARPDPPTLCTDRDAGTLGPSVAHTRAAATPEREDEPLPDDVHLLDVRGLEPPEPLVRTLEALRSLPWGHTLVQLYARMPSFLLRELEAQEFSWTLLEDTPGRVRIAIRHASPLPIVDLRLLAAPERHARALGAVAELKPGSAFVLVDAHDPVAGRRWLDDRHPGAFTWEYLEAGPSLWRVHVRRTA